MTTSRTLPRFGVCSRDALPQAFQRVGPRHGTQALVGAEPLHNGLDDLLPDVFGSGLPLPVIKHLCQSPDDGCVLISLLALESEELSELLQ